MSILGVLALGLSAFVAPSLAQAESIEVAHGASPTQDIALSITVSGVADGHHRLYVVVHEGEEGCATFPDFETGTHLASGESLSAGSYEKTYNYTPSQPGTYAICAYLDEAEYETPDVTNTGSFTAVMPSGAVSLEVTGKMTQEVPLKIKVSGTTEVARKLYVTVHEGGEGCATFPDFETGTHLASGESLSAGSYSKEYTYTPPQPGTYTVCGYIDEAEYTTPDATGSASFTAGPPAGSVSVSISPTSSEDAPVGITVSGTTEVPRKLYVTVHEGGESCATYPDFETGTHLASGETLAAGSYSKAYSFTPTKTTAYTVCGYLDEAEYSSPDATGSGTFSNITPATREEEAKRAAEQMAERTASEAAQAAEQKKLAEYLHGVAEKGQCGELSSEYEASIPACKADEAAIKAAEEREIKAEEAALSAKRTAAHKQPVRHLSIKVMSHLGTTSKSPGYTNFDLTTAPYAYVTIHLSRYGHRTYSVEWGEHGTERAVKINWSCESPGGLYHYVVTAHSNVGRTLTRRGTFAPVSVARCHAMEKREAEARERHEREVTERYEHEAREEEERHREEVRLYEKNCRAVGGTPVLVEYPGGEQYYRCRAPGGGTIPGIPY